MKTKFGFLTVFAVLALSLSACGPAALSAVGVIQPEKAATQSTTAPTNVSAPTNATAPTTNAVAAPLAATGSVSDLESTLEQIYAQVNPSVVAIDVIEGNTTSGFGILPQGHPSVPSGALGSGFVWDKDGHIVTNNHVVAGATKISVTFYDGTIVPATLVGADPDSDLAVIKVNLPADQLQPVTLGDSTSVKVGQLSVAIGNPFGNQNTMTVGFISALARSLPTTRNDRTSQSGSYTIPDVIQTDTAINPGNSGGVLTDDQGHVIGVTAAIDSQSGSSAGVGFAIPSVIVQKVVPGLISSGKYEHSWLGISGRTLIPDFATAMNLKSDQRGVLVGSVTSGSPAEKAGILGSTKDFSLDGQTTQVGGDVITAIDNQTVKTFDDLVSYLARSTQVGQTVKLTILRNGESQTVDVTLAARPAVQPQTAQDAPQITPPLENPGTPLNTAWLGIQGLTVTSDIAAAMNLKSDAQGVLVEQVLTDSPAERAGLKAGTKTTTLNGQDITLGGDVITAIDGRAVTSMQQLQRALQRYTADQKITLTILRDGQSQEVGVTLAARPVVQ